MDHLKALAARSKALQVNGANVIRWAEWLVATQPDATGSNDVIPLVINPSMDEYSTLNGVPDAILLGAIYPETAAEANIIANAMSGDKEGYAQTRYGSAEHAASGGGDGTPSVEAERDGADNGIDEYEALVRVLKIECLNAFCHSTNEILHVISHIGQANQSLCVASSCDVLRLLLYFAD